MGETEYAVGAIPLGGYVKITGMNPHEEMPPEVAPRAYYRQPVWKRIAVILAGPTVNIVLAFLILWALFVANGIEDTSTTRVESLEPGTPAMTVLHPGDEILAVDGVSGDRGELAEQINGHRCAGEPRPRCRAAEPAELRIRRDGQELTVQARPVYDERRERMRLGFSFASVRQDVGPAHAAGLSVSEMWRFTSATVSTIVRLFDPEVRDDLSGVVGGYEVTRQAVQIDLTLAAYFLAVISLSLGVINLFPFLPLDGGHIFWALAEKVRGRPIPFRVLERAGFVGFALVLMLFAIGFTNDLERLSGEGFRLR